MDDKKYLSSVKDKMAYIRNKTVVRGSGVSITRDEVMWLCTQLDMTLMLHETDHDLANKWRLQRDKAEAKNELLVSLLKSCTHRLSHPEIYGEYEGSELKSQIEEEIGAGSLRSRRNVR